MIFTSRTIVCCEASNADCLAETGRKTSREQLFGIGSVAAQPFGKGQIDTQQIIGRLGMTIAATRCGYTGYVKVFGHCFVFLRLHTGV